MLRSKNHKEQDHSLLPMLRGSLLPKLHCMFLLSLISMLTYIGLKINRHGKFLKPSQQLDLSQINKDYYEVFPEAINKS